MTTSPTLTREVPDDSIPSRWRPWARARWRDRLFVRAHQELLRQRAFARGKESGRG